MPTHRALLQNALAAKILTMHSIVTTTLAAAVMCLAGQAQAINKCTDPAGKVIYQEHPCAEEAKAQKIENAPDPQAAGKRWVFSQKVDEMTGAKTCFASSATTYTNYRSVHAKMAVVWVQVAMTPTAQRLSIRSIDGGDGLFHTDIAGVGIKVDSGGFKPVTQKIGSHGLGFDAGTEGAILSEMTKGRAIRMRLRFWPYERLHDTEEVSLTGFPQAMAAAMRCTAP